MCSYGINLKIRACANKATTTTEESIITPATIGFTPTPATSLKLVFMPIAPRAVASMNLAAVAIPLTVDVERKPVLLTATIPRKPKMNQGKIFEILMSARLC